VMLAIAFALSEKYGRWRLTLPEIAAELGFSDGTIRNKMSKGEYRWIKKDGGTLFADVRDVAAYLDEKRKKAPERTEG